LSFCYLLVAANPMAAEFPTAQWPQFRGPTGQGISTATGVPIR
jgi:hypothetical protein